MSELNGSDTGGDVRDGRDTVPSSKPALEPASAGLSKVGISAMQGIDLLEPIKPEEWNTRPEPAPEQVEPEKITQADLEAPIKKSPVYNDPTVEDPEKIFDNPDLSAPLSEGPVESPVSRRG